MRTFVMKKEDVVRKWHHIDATGLVLGRLAVEIARILMGKHRATYTPHVDTGDFVVVTNAEKVKVTGRKMTDKLYWRDSGALGSLRSVNMATLMARKPDQVLKLAVRRMLPKTTLGRRMLRKLKVYAGPEHPHAAQQPETLDLRSVAARAEDKS
jgi:large subunit ribosomal protein L13